jgi:glycosyltransferase involved in cell wall biosynthesis
MGRLFDRIKKFNLLGKLPIGFHSDAPIDARSGKDANNKEFIHDIVINTHGDVLPYYLPSFSPRTTIVYCHYPVAIDPIRSRDLSYLKYLSDLGLVGKEILNGDAQTQSEFWYNLQQQYLNMLRNSLLLTNSNFSKEAILKTLESNKFATNVPLIIPPPVNVEEFRRAALFSAERKDYVLVVSRIHPSKKLENAIELARILKHYRIAKGMVIAGSLVDDDIFANDYYQRILDMIRAFGLSDYVTIEINVGLARLKSLMRNSKAYFHPLPGEPFGISIVEAMSAGLIPVVPDSGGHTEFVPKKYQFDSLKAAADVILSALDVTQIERLRISNLVINSSLSEYSIRFQRAIRTMLISSMNAVPAISRERLV